MVLSIFALLLVLGITFMHSIFGLFSGLINALCCVTAMCVAFGFTDTVNELVAGQGLHPAYTLPVCFVLLFFLTHLILRLLADNFIRGNIRVPMYVDWGGGAFCGFIIAQITVGVLVLGFLMLPWGGAFEAEGSRVMMYAREQRVEDREAEAVDDKVTFKHNNVAWFLRPDEFTVGFFNLLSNGSLRGQTTFASIYPNFPEWVFWTGNTVQDESTTSPFRDDNGDGFGDKGLRVESWWEQRDSVPVRYRWALPTRTQTGENWFEYRDYRPEPGKTLLGTRLVLNKSSADRDERGAHHRFRSTMIRIVGDVNGTPRDYPARILGGVDPGTDDLRLADLDNNFAVAAGGDTQVDAYFEVDEGFVPRFVEYRRHARAPIKADARAEAAPTQRIFVAMRGSGSAGGASGPMRFIDAFDAEFSGDLVDLPFVAARAALASSGEVEFAGDKFKSGRFAGLERALAGAGPGSVREIDLPEGRRLFQLRCNPQKARSLAGQVFNFVGATVNQYSAIDSQGNSYPLAGYYAIVNRHGETHVEFFLAGGDEAAAFRGMLDFKHIDRNEELRRPDSKLGLLFFVPPGVRITEVKTQTGEGLTFPDDGFQMNG